jgi:hypothetical protein
LGLGVRDREKVDFTRPLICTGSRAPKVAVHLVRPSRVLDIVPKCERNNDSRKSWLLRTCARYERVKADASLVHSPSNPSPSPQIPSSIPTCLHHGVSVVVGLTMFSASPTCLLALTSLPFVASPGPAPLLFNFIAMLESVKLGISLCCLPTRVNPWDEREAVIPNLPTSPLPRLCEDPFVHSSLMTGRCHCRGSELDDKRFKCR